MDHCSVWSNAGNCVKREAFKLISLFSVFFESLSPTVLVDSMVWLFQLFFKESKILHDSCTVSNVTLPHSLLLDFIFIRFQKSDDTFILSEDVKFVFLEQTENLLIAPIFVD